MATSGSGGNLMFSAGISFAKTGTATDKEINAELNRIQHLINSKQLWVKLGIDPNAKTFLRNYGRDAETIEKKMRAVAQAIQRLQKSGNYWDKSGNGMTAAAQRLTQTYHELSVLRRTSSLKANEFEKMIVKNINEEVKAQERAEKAAQRKAEAMKRAADKQASALQKVNGLFGVQDGYVQSLIARLATYASIGAIGAFLTKVREVTAEFELQRVSLGAIIQDQNRANALFSEIKSFALKSPVKILDLTRYTKQLAAYQIETEKLFDTTKRLTDVSVGLGVDMSRLILAYGETKASNVMNAKELRQFAMMGIPMLELLSEKLSEIYGKTISTGEAFQMIKKRMVHFDVVAQIFEDLTNKGGTFYNMQEKQGNTLYGMWAKLGDAASVMYDQIGNTEWVNAGMRGLINLLRSFMLAWRDVGRGMLVAASAFIVWKANSAIIASTIGKSAALKIATDNLATAHLRLNAAMKSGNTTLLFSEKLKLKAAQSSLAAARANGFWATSMLKLRAAMLRLDAAIIANWPTILATAGIAIWMWLDSASEKANKLKNALNEIQISSLTESSKSVRNFESLAQAAVNARDGSKAQRDALEELHTTYGKILPTQGLQIEKLRELKGNYTSLTETIREYVAAQKMQEGITTILEDYAPKIKSAEDTIKNVLKNGFNYATEFGEDFLSFQDEQVDRMIENAKRLSKDTSLSMQQVWEKVFRMEGIDFKFDEANAMKINLDLIFGMDKLTEVVRKQEVELGKWDKSIKNLFPTLGNLAKLMNEAQEEIENADYHAPKTTFLFDEEKTKKSIEIYVAKLKEAFNQAGLEINLDEYIHFNEDGKFDRLDWSALQTKLDELSNIVEQKELELRAKRDAYNKQYQAELAKGKDGDEEKAQEYYNNMTQIIEQLNNLVPVSSIKNMATEVQGIFEDLVPKDVLVRELREKLIEISGTYGFVGEGMDKMRQYFWSGEKSLKDHIDELDKEEKKLEQTIYGYKKLAAELGLTNAQMLENYGIDLEEETRKMEALGKIIEKYKEYVPADAWKNKKGSQSDPRLQILQEMVSTLKNVNKEYDDLLKKEGQSKALADVQNIYADTFKNMQDLAKKYKFNFPEFGVPTDTASLARYLNSIKDAMKKLPKSDKSVLALQVDIDKINLEDAQKKIDAQLKNLQSRIEQSKTAKEFYDKILRATGDVDIAANVTMSIYGDTGSQLDAQLAREIKEMFGQYKVEVPVTVIGDDNRINYLALEKYVRKMQQELGGVDSKTYQDLLKIAQQGQKDWAKTYEGYLKDLEKAKSYSDKRIELAKKTANTIAGIQKDVNMPQSEKERLTKGYQEKEAKEAANLAYEAFKDSPMYVAMFEDLDYASTTMLDNMKQRLQSLQGEWKNLDPRNLKEMQKRLDEINKQLIQRNPFKTLSNAIKEYQELSKGGSYKDAEKNLADWEDKRKKAWDELQKQTDIDPNSDLTKAAKDLYDYTVKNANEAEKLMERWQRVKETIGLSVTELFKVMDMFGQTARGIADLTENFGGSEEDVQYWNDIADGLDAVSAGVQDIISSVLQGNVIGIVSSALTAIPKMIIGFTQIFDAGKIRKANKEIARQQELLEQLEYTYSRLQKSQEKLFGSDYIQNYNQQLENLAAQAEAYQKQADAERSKGKKADKDKIQDYENSWRDTIDEIKDMQGELTTYFAGTDITSAARDFANSWLEARWAFEDTTEAMREKFADMVQNMIVESMAARLMQNILQPIYDMIDEATADNDITAQEIAAISAKAYESIGTMNNAMETMLAQLEQAGLDLSQMFSEGGTDLTGISRDIATASEESINGLAQGINTQNYYISHVPTISENVAAIRILMEGGAVAQVGGDYNTLQNEHLAQLPIIAANTLATAERCERAAVACEEMADNIRRVVDPRGGKFVLRTTLN